MSKSLFAILYFTLISARPTTWIRIFAEMLFGFSFAAGYDVSKFFMLFLGFISVGPLLWSAAYILNDITDIKYDLQHASRKKRPIAQGIFIVPLATRAVLILTLLAIFFSSLVNSFFVVGVILLIISQVLYTLKPFRLKEVYFFDLFLNGLNGGIRFVLGFIAGGGHLDQLPYLFLIFAIFLKVILFIGHRLQNRQLELKNNIQSSITVLSLLQVKILLAILMLLMGFLYVVSLWYYLLNFMLLIPVGIAIIFLLPILYFKRIVFIQKEEKNIVLRVYLYIILLIFAVSFFIIKNI